MTVALLLLATLREDVDKAALRASLTLPTIETEIGFDIAAYEDARAKEVLTSLQPEILKKPVSAEVMLKVANNLLLTGDVNGADQYYQKSLDALGKPIPKSPEEAAIQVEALINLMRFDEAEKTLEGSPVPVRPKFLAALLAERQSLAELYGSSGLLSKLDQEESRSLVEAWLSRRPPILEKIKEAIAESPDQLEPYKLAKSNLNATSALRFSWKVATHDPTPGSYLDVQSGAYLKDAMGKFPNDAVLICEFYWTKFTLASGQPDIAGNIADCYAKLAPETKTFLDGLEARLKSLCSGEGVNAQTANEALGIITIAKGSPKDSLPYFEAALSKSPEDSRLQDLVLDANLLAQNDAKVVELGSERAKVARSSENEVKVIKCLDRLGKSDEAYTRVLADLVVMPDSALLQLTRAALILKEPTGRNLGEASAILADFVALPGGLPRLMRDDVTFYRSVLFGLLGETGEAKRLLDGLIKDHPKEGKYLSARKALGS